MLKINLFILMKKKSKTYFLYLKFNLRYFFLQDRKYFLEMRVSLLSEDSVFEKYNI